MSDQAGFFGQKGALVSICARSGSREMASCSGGERTADEPFSWSLDHCIRELITACKLNISSKKQVDAVSGAALVVKNPALGKVLSV